MQLIVSPAKCDAAELPTLDLNEKGITNRGLKRLAPNNEIDPLIFACPGLLNSAYVRGPKKVSLLGARQRTGQLMAEPPRFAS